MKGIIISHFYDFVNEKHGEQVLNEMKKLAGLKGTIIFAVNNYPDEKVVECITHTATLTKKSVNDILYDFGVYWIPNQGVKNYSHYFSPYKNVKDFLKNQDNVHIEVTQNMAGASPPQFEYIDDGTPDRLTIIYKSKRKLCPFLRGAIVSTSEYFKQKVDIREPKCMYRGNDICQLELTFHS